MWSLYVSAEMPGSVPLLVVFLRYRRDGCAAWQATSRRRRRPFISANRPTLFGRIFELIDGVLRGSSPEKTLLQLKIVF